MSRKTVLSYQFKPEFSLEELTQQFVYLKQAQGMAERTIKDYKNTFKKFIEFSNLSTLELIPLKSELLRFFTTLTDKAPATFNRPYSNLNAFFNWCVNEDYLTKNPIKALGLKKKKDEGRVRHIDEDVVSKLLNCIDLTTYAGFRDYCLILLTLDTGIRPKEAFHLKESDIDFTSHSLTIRKEIAKTRTSRILPLSPQTIELLRKLLLVKPDDWEDWVFCTVEGYILKTVRWVKRMDNYSKQIGHKITPYDLRHTFAIMFLRNGGNAFALQHELGHSDLTMTKRYVKLTQEDLKEHHAYASPVNKFIRRTTRVQKLFK